MMKNVNQEGSLCLEKKYEEINGKEVKRWIFTFFFDFFSLTFCCLWKKGSVALTTDNITPPSDQMPNIQGGGICSEFEKKTRDP